MNSFMSPEPPHPIRPKRCPGPFAPIEPRDAGWSRRRFLQTSGHGFGAMALAYLLAHSTERAVASAVRGTSNATGLPKKRGPHFAARAKRCIFLFMVGGPSQMELFDPKPALDKLHGQRL